jgi:hypothetical protein
MCIVNFDRETLSEAAFHPVRNNEQDEEEPGGHP